MKKTLALALAVIMICVCALTVSAAETTLPELDCTGWWTAHTEGVEITAEGAEITFTNTTYETAAENWNAPIWILYTGDEAKVNGAGYNEYWVHRADNYGWAGAWGNFVNTGDMAAVNALGVTVEAAFEAGCWDNWVADLKAGHECVVTGILEGTNAIISIKCHGVTNTVTIPVDADKPVYLSLSGELTKLSNIVVTTPEEETQPTEPETQPTEPETQPTEPETQPTEPSIPETEATQPEATEPATKPANPGTGDNSPVMLAAVMMMAAACLIVLVQKKRAF